MDLHDNLYALGLQLGRDVFDDPESFRGALDDFLDEGDASTGDINLLVDAVRLGAFRSMVSILDSGADASRAIEEAGNRLARDRGSADVAGAQWACAVLGFAVGKVADGDVRRYRTQTPGRSTRTPPAAETMLPTTPPAGPTQGPPPAGPTALPGTAGFPGQTSGPGSPGGPGGPGGPSAVPPTQTAWSSQPQPGGQPGPSMPGPGGWSQGPGPQGPGGYGAPAKKKKSKALPIVLAVVAVLVVAGIVATLLVVTGGDDEPAAKEKKDEPEVASTDFDSVNERYSGLSSLITTGMDECTEGEMSSGQEENLVCTYPDGELRLITYSSEQDLQAARARDVDLKQIGGNYLDAGTGVVYGFKPENDDTDTIDAPYLYWDNVEAVQSARYQGNVGVELDALVRTFGSTEPSIGYPTKPTDPDLREFAKNFVNFGSCERINTYTAGETEELSCRGPAGITPYFGKFETIADLKTYRRIKLGFAREDKTKNRTWNLDGVTVGALYDYTIDADDRAARYWDDPECLCYGEAYEADGNAEKLGNWWGR
jgi:hypothetical protein